MRHLILSLVLASAACAQAPAPPALPTLDLPVPMVLEADLMLGAQRTLDGLRKKDPNKADAAAASWAGEGVAARTRESVLQSMKDERQRQDDEANVRIGAWKAYVRYMVALERLDELNKAEAKKKADAEAAAKATPSPTPTATPTPAPKVEATPAASPFPGPAKVEGTSVPEGTPVKP